MRFVSTVERYDTTTVSYAFDYHIIKHPVELANVFAGYDGPVIVDGRSVHPNTFVPYILFRLDNNMRYYLDMQVAGLAKEDGLELPFDVRGERYTGSDYFQGLG